MSLEQPPATLQSPGEQTKSANSDVPPTNTSKPSEPSGKEDKKLPATQKSWRATRRGEPAKVLKLAEDTPVPAKLKKGEVLVKVQAAALNPV